MSDSGRSEGPRLQLSSPSDAEGQDAATEAVEQVVFGLLRMYSHC